MTPTATYIAEENCLQEEPCLPEPSKIEAFNDFVAWYGHVDMEGAYKKYNKHVDSLRRIPCDPSCKGLWADGQKVLENVDYVLKEVPCPYFEDVNDPVEYTTKAFPIVPVKSEDELWREVAENIRDNHVWQRPYSGRINFNVEEVVAEMKKQYIITKR